MRAFVMVVTGLAGLAVVAMGFVAATMVYCAKVIKDSNDKPISICTGEWALDGLIYPLGIAIAVLFVGGIILTVMQAAKPRPTPRALPPAVTHDPYRQLSRLDPEAVRYAGLYAHRIVRTICWSPLPIIFVTGLFTYLTVVAAAPEIKRIIGSSGVFGEVIKQGVKEAFGRLF